MQKFKILSPYIKKNFNLIFFSLCLIFITALISTVPAIITKDIIDTGFGTGNFSCIIKMSILLAGLFLIKSVLNWLINFISAKTGENITNDFRKDIVAETMSLPMDFFMDKDSAYISARLGEVGSVTSLFSPTNFKFITGVFEALFSFVILLNMNWQMTLIMVLPTTIFFAVANYAMKKYGEVINASLEYNATFSGKITESIKAQEEIRIHSKEKEEEEKLAQYSEKIKDLNIKQSMILGISTETLTILASLITVLVYIVGGYFFTFKQLTFGQFISFSQYIGKIYSPIISFSAILITTQPAIYALERLSNFLSFDRSISNKKSSIDITNITHISVENLSFRYPNTEKILFNGLSFNFFKNGLYLIKGANGSGKSTLIKILLKLYNTYDGTIKYNDIDLFDIKEKSVREKISVVSQNIFLFNDTIKNNLFYGANCEAAANREVIFELVGINRLLSQLPEKEQTLVGENGLKLSGGERQKISIARALLKNSDCLLFDEPMSNIDENTKIELHSILQKISAEKIIIVIDHSDQFDSWAKQILYL